MLDFSPLDGAVGTLATAVATMATISAPLTGANATAAGIIAATILVRLLISPLSYLQARAQRRQAALAPRLRELRHRYRDDRARLQAETMALYREAGANPLGGCLPALLQAPFFLVMYRLATAPPDGSDLLSEPLFGVALGHRLADGLAGPAGPVFGGLFLLLTALAWALSRRARQNLTSDAAAGSKATAAGNAATGTQPGASAGLARLLPLLPYGTVLLAGFVPLAAGLYLLTTTAWTLLEQLVLRRRRPHPAASG